MVLLIYLIVMVSVFFLAGVDYMFPASGEGSNYPPLKPLPALEKYDPPEKSSKSRKSEKW